ncbi:N-acyl amino acid synthase, PEP-CTERM/exosortase system-associated [Nitrosospira multiformis]|uniref:N-acyl amino acid synthase, PEP-CTERM/exosortase system-associated n=1 Tax=Nitrosospira multiformis TaxID=1231 RepID=A0A1I7H2N9_9PROT|nr:N-acyl amino acid synthase, PEP-CTERM/exosortase system-associated [Nitrosospira multiformis]
MRQQCDFERNLEMLSCRKSLQTNYLYFKFVRGEIFKGGWHRSADVSRLAVTSSYRRRKGEAGRPLVISDGDFKTSRSRRFPYIPISLYLATFAMARLNKIDTVFVLTEERLAHHFAKPGFDQKFIGGPVDHHAFESPR